MADRFKLSGGQTELSRLRSTPARDKILGLLEKIPIGDSASRPYKAQKVLDALEWTGIPGLAEFGYSMGSGKPGQAAFELAMTGLPGPGKKLLQGAKYSMKQAIGDMQRLSREEAPVAIHSSPNKFDEFSDEFLGEGEGTQIEGAFNYLSDSPPAIRFYRRSLSKPGIKHAGGISQPLKVWNEKAIPSPYAEYLDTTTPEGKAFTMIKRVSGLRDRPNAEAYNTARGFLQRQYEQQIGRLAVLKDGIIAPGSAWKLSEAISSTNAVAKTTSEAIDILRQWEKNKSRPVDIRNSYLTRIHAPRSNMMSLDQKIGDQPQVERGIYDLIEHEMLGKSITNEEMKKIPEITGQGAYNLLDRAFIRKYGEADLGIGENVQRPLITGKALDKAGIRGATWINDDPDFGSSQGFNYGVFDPKRLEILRRFGILPAAGLGGLGLMDRLPDAGDRDDRG